MFLLINVISYFHNAPEVYRLPDGGTPKRFIDL